MYLIKCDGSYRLDFHHGPTVEYLILSHTWGPNDDEVSFQDTANLEMARKKNGFSKIEQICTRAREEGIPYAWVDTCCIDKSSSAEPSESINSMYKWYYGAVYCVAYVEDLETRGNEDLESQLSPCRWFTRGWTLQELISPKSVVFVDKGWKEWGTRRDLSSVLSRITGISTAILDGTRALHQIAVAQRMSWVAKRQTTRTEDMAYCLFGIFDINMPLLYGEGSKAFVRLQQAILQQTGDLSIFAWTLPKNLSAEFSKLDAELIGLVTEATPFAFHAACFEKCQTMERFTSSVLPNPSVTISSTGIRLLGCIIKMDQGCGDPLLHLQCKAIPDATNRDKYTILALDLLQVPDGYLREFGCVEISPTHSIGLGVSMSRQALAEI